MKGKILIITLLVGLITIFSVMAVSTLNHRNDVEFDSVTAENIYTQNIMSEYSDLGYITAQRIILNNGAFMVEGMFIRNTFNNWGIIIDDLLKVNELETGTNQGEALCVDSNNYLCRCGYCA